MIIKVTTVVNVNTNALLLYVFMFYVVNTPDVSSELISLHNVNSIYITYICSKRGMRRRRQRCKQCDGCKAENCGLCKFCENPQLKKPCILRMCHYLY